MKITPQSADQSIPAAEQVRRCVEKILSSATFANSGRMSRFLRFAVEEMLAGRAALLKEYTLGVAVFDRPADFDPRTDPIVRVEARRLRDKLAAYYASDASDDLVVELPKGGYAPRVVPRKAPVAMASPAAATMRLAVLPFSNLGGAEEYFSEGLAEELIHLLTRMPRLEVIAWNTSARIQAESDEVERLKLNYLLRGSVRSASGQVRVSVQLIELPERRYVWSEVYERELGDLLSIEGEIAREIAARLRISFDCTNGGRRTRPAHGSPEHTHYLIGRFHSNRRTIEGLEKSLRSYQQAIAINPDYALAHAALADAFSLLSTYGAVHPAESVPLARASAQRALELDAEDAGASAYAALALITGMHDWNWTEAEALYRKALDRDPNHAVARYWFACDHLAALGRFDEALREMAIACRLDPLSSVIQDGPGYIYMLQRRFDDSLRHYQSTADRDPLFYLNHTSIGRIHALAGRHGEALEAYRRGRKLAGFSAYKVDAAIAQALGQLGRREEAFAVLNGLLETAKTAFVPSTAIAIAYMGLHEIDKALDAMEAAVEAREFSVALMNVHPVYDPLRGSPRFQALLERLHLTVRNPR